MKKFDAFQIKLFMAVLMVLDHLPHIHGLIPPMWIGIFHLVTRCVSCMVCIYGGGRIFCTPEMPYQV